MPLISGDGPNQQKATAKGKLIKSTPAPAPAPTSRPAARPAPSAGSTPAPSASQGFTRNDVQKLLGFSYEIPAHLSQDPVKRLTQTVPAAAALQAAADVMRNEDPADRLDAGKKQMKATLNPMDKVNRPGGKSYKMTWDEYNKLDPKQRAAVDFNTMLVEARQKDLKNQDAYESIDKESKQNYDKAVRRMFGEDGGSETYAPETMAVLRQIDFDGKAQHADLDEFLSLQAAISEADLKNFQAAPKGGERISGFNLGGGATSQYDPNLATQTALVENTAKLTEAMQRGGQMLASFRKSVAMDPGRQDDLLNFANIDPRKFGAPSTGYGDPSVEKSVMVNGAVQTQNELTMDGYFNIVLSKLAEKGTPLETVMADVQDQLKPEEQQSLWAFVDAKTRNAVNFNARDMYKGKGFRDAAEIRKLLALDKGE